MPYANGCSFGGCIITADGTLLLQDAYTQTYELLERSGAFHDFTVPLAYAITDLPIVNNAKDVLYAIGTTTGGTFSITPELYTVATGRVTSVPQIPGNSCTEYYPVSFNNSGHVLGYTAGCPKNDQTYFTYDSKNGTRDLGAELPGGYPFIDPIGINDRDEILVALTDAAGAAHWGVSQAGTCDQVRDSCSGGCPRVASVADSRHRYSPIRLAARRYSAVPSASKWNAFKKSSTP